MNESIDIINKNIDTFKNLPIQITVEVGRCLISLKDLMSINIGSVIPLNKYAGESCDIYANNKKIGNGMLVVINDHFGVRLEAICTESEQLEYTLNEVK